MNGYDRLNGYARESANGGRVHGYALEVLLDKALDDMEREQRGGERK